MSERRKRRVFLVGPLDSYGDYAANVAAFHAKARVLRAIGYEVWNPCEGRGRKTKTHEQYMRRSIHELTRQGVRGGDGKPYYDALVLLPGAWQSKGALAEIFVGKAIGVFPAAEPVG